MAPPQYACSRCGSNDFEETDGIWYCHNGHEQEGGQQIGQDDADFGKIGKINRQKQASEKQRVLKVYRGVRGFQLYLKAWQYVLWKQCYALVHRHGLPEQLWTLVRELWALRLTKLAPRLDESTSAKEISDLSSTSGSESGKEIEDRENRSKRSRHIEDNPTLPDTISFVYFGILLLHHPTRLSTLYRLIRQERLCYIRAIRHIPQELRDHLAPEYHLALDTTVIPTEHNLQLAVYQTVTMFSRAFTMIIPPINWALIVMDSIRQLALPLEVFPAVKYLAQGLKYDFSYQTQHKRRRNATTYPEAQLMALIVVATKLIYPFDSTTAKLSAKTIQEPSAIVMDWQGWLEARIQTSDTNKTQPMKAEHAIEVTDKDVLQMSEDQLDKYMDWFQQTYVKNVRGEPIQKQILNMFPLKDIIATEGENHSEDEYEKHTLEQLRATQAQLKVRPILAQDEDPASATNRVWAGQVYRRYRSCDEMGEAAKHFHQEAAKLACLDVDALIRACLRTERSLLINQHEQRRREYFEAE